MDLQIPEKERIRLRELAKRQAELAARPVMAQRRKDWMALNDGLPGARPMVMVDNWTFDRDFMPESIYRCETEEGRGIEKQLLRAIRTCELIDDDKVVPDTFDIGWSVHMDPLGVEIPVERIRDGQGYETGYRFLHPIQDLQRDLHLVKPVTCSVDRGKTAGRKEFLENLFGDILPVTIRTGVMGATSLTQLVVRLMGMEAFFLAMYDAPEAVHALMARLRDNCLGSMRWAEAEGLLRLNNGNQNVAGSGFNFTASLPAPGYTGPAARLRDMWSSAESQETVGVAPDTFGEFCAPYYRAVCEPCGLVYWGCCEPASPLWEHIRTIPHLKKVSISRWCDEAFMGEVLRGTAIVYSRKPDPKFLGVDVKLDEEAWAEHIRATLEAARGVGVEFAIRDVYTVHGDLGKVRRAVEIIRSESERTGRRRAGRLSAPDSAMNSRERMLAAFNRQPVDRIPTDLWATAEVWAKLCAHFGEGADVKAALGIDGTHGTGPEYVGPALPAMPEGESADYWGIRRKNVAHPGGVYSEQSFRPLAFVGTMDDLERYAWPEVGWFDYSKMREKAIEGRKTHAVACGYMAPFYYHNLLRGLEQSLVDPYENPELTHEIVRRISEFFLAFHRRMFETCEGLIDVTQVTDDLGSQTGPLIGMDLYREFYAPWHAKMIALAHEFGIKVMHHDDGSCRAFIPLLIEMGIDILNPIQWKCPGMDMNELKAEYGKRLCFHGAVENQGILPFGTPEDVRAEVRHCIDALASDGTGYVLASCHALQGNTPLENVLAMYDEARKYGPRVRGLA